jgi:hydroxyacylglutathione hydrolase
MLLRRFYDDKLAQASYMIGCQATGEAIVVDPHRDTDVYIAAAEEEDLRIRYVSETHIHADYLSGSRQLARRTDATFLISGDGDEDWQYAFAGEEGTRVVHDGDEVTIGNIGIRILHTPGHTPEHISFMITDGATSSEPMGVLTGDFIFVGDVGRPDLLEKAAGIEGTMEKGARVLYRAIERFRGLPAYLQILPGHGAGSACGKALGSVPSSTLGYEQLVNWAFQCETEDDFVLQVLSDQPEPPVYFAHMKRMNREGPAILDGLPHPPHMDPSALGPLMDEGGIVVDTRPQEQFAAGHVPGTINVPLTNSFPNWCGWLLPYDRPIHFIVGGEGEAMEAARDLAFIGIDHSAGYFGENALEAWAEHHGPLETFATIDWAAAERAVADEHAFLLDVRKLTEWNEGHAPGATHIHLGYLRGRTDELPRDRPVLLYCRSGHRSGIGSSLLQAEGFEDVRNIDGGIVDRIRRGLPTEVPEGA